MLSEHIAICQDRKIKSRVIVVLMTLLPASAWSANAGAPPELREWLDRHPRVRDEIRWESQEATLRFPEWPPTLQQMLIQAFARAWRKESLNPSRIPRNLAPQKEDERIGQILLP